MWNLVTLNLWNLKIQFVFKVYYFGGFPIKGLKSLTCAKFYFKSIVAKGKCGKCGWWIR